MRASKTIKKLQRKIQLRMLEKASPEGLIALGEKKLLRLFRKAKNSSFALAQLLNEHRIDPESITTIDSFTALDFTTCKENTFNAFPLDQLCISGGMEKLGSVLTSSGHSGNFAFGLNSWQQIKKAPDLIDLALQNAFQIDEKKTLLLNCLPMGVRFPSNSVTQAEVSVREDMALALIEKFSSHYDQVIIVCDPLFLKLLIDTSKQWPINWGAFKKHLIIGEETFGENYRDYVGKQLHINPDDPDTGLIGSSMGVGELGLNLGFETVETIALRRIINKSPELLRTLFGWNDANDPLPMLFAYNPLSYYLETIEINQDGFGHLLVSILDKKEPIPLFRYQTGDKAKLLTSQDIEAAFEIAGLPRPMLPKFPLMCIRGRDKDRLASGLHIGAIKDALYQDHDFADRITGAFRIEQTNPTQIHIQLRPMITPESIDLTDINVKGTILFSKENIRLWDFDAFPFGKTIDYERKFSYLA